jgi:hypothetical protein
MGQRMSCLLPLIANAICLFQPSELRLQADASTAISGGFHYYVNGRDFGTGLVGRVSLSMDVPVSRRFTVRYGVLHQSLLDTDEDRGSERAFVGFVWRPL